jgi:UDP-2,4-diacetamido-2,4,6-trideoxy-beta-L-altropyranose hydrolase
MTAASLLTRVDASLTMGTGHVMRCIALAQAWQDACGSATFVMAESTPGIQARLAQESCELLSISCAAGSEDDALEAIRLARGRQVEWIVVDGYQFGADYQRTLKAAGFKVLFLDDYGHASHYFADLVLNQNEQAKESLYEAREPHTRPLLGTEYCLLRREFASWRGWKRETPAVGGKVLVTMGGSDPENVTATVIEALRTLSNVEATVVVGGSNPHFAKLQESAALYAPRITVRRDVSNMAELMASADVAVSASGSTCWELCFLGLPALLLDVAPNQTELARELDRRGCAIHLGDHRISAEKVAGEVHRLLSSRELRQSVSQSACQLVDGDGARRVVSILRGADNRDSEGLSLRRARAEDGRLLWEWANDPDVRSASFSSTPISWETHAEWLAERLSQDTNVILIAEDETTTPCGQIRFEPRPDGDWEVSVSIARGMRGRGLASTLIGLGVQEIGRRAGNVRVHAFVKPANTASAKAFARAGFASTGTEEVRGSAAMHLIYPKKEPSNR